MWGFHHHHMPRTDHSKLRYNVVPQCGFYCMVSQCMISYSDSTSWTIMSCRVLSYHIISYPCDHGCIGPIFTLKCSVSFLCILKHIINAVFASGVRVLGFELRVQWHRHISLSAASNEFCKFVSLKSCKMWRSNTSNGWCWAHLEWAKKLRKCYSKMIEAEINSNQEGFKVPAFGWHPPQPFMLKYPPKWKWVHPSRRWA